MSALEIVAIVILCILGISIVLLWGQTISLFNQILIKQREEKKPAPKNEAPKENP